MATVLLLILAYVGVVTGLAPFDRLWFQQGGTVRVRRLHMSGDSGAEKAICCDRKPVVISVKAGETYFWCSCGRSATQPFCDGAHFDTAFVPIVSECSVIQVKALKIV
jgi:CDGSH-type Zn-finger protein